MKKQLNENLLKIIQNISSHTSIGRLNEAKNDEEEDAPEDIQPTDGTEQPESDVVDTPPTEEPQSEPAPDSMDAIDNTESPEDVKNDAGVAQAELEKAKAQKAAAEEELDEQGHIKLVSSKGVQALLQIALEPAIKTNTIDSLAKTIVDKLAIEDQDDFKSFKDETIEFRGIIGFNQLIESMEPFIGSTSKVPSEAPSEEV